MAEWIGHFIANWPIWLILPVALLAGILFYGYNFMFSKPGIRYEWPDDKKKRLAREEARRTSKLKLKKG